MNKTIVVSKLSSIQKCRHNQFAHTMYHCIILQLSILKNKLIGLVDIEGEPFIKAFIS